MYAPDLPGLHTQGEDIDDAAKNAEEALSLYVEGLREDGGSLDTALTLTCERERLVDESSTTFRS